MAVFEWLQSKLHAECDHVIDHYDRERRTAAQAQRESAQAHHEAEQALAEARTQIARLEAETVGERARADRAEAALREVRRLVAEPVDLTRPLIDQMDEVYVELTNAALIRNALRIEANQYPGDYGEHMHALADRFHARVLEALEATKTTASKEMSS